MSVAVLNLKIDVLSSPRTTEGGGWFLHARVELVKLTAKEAKINHMCRSVAGVLVVDGVTGLGVSQMQLTVFAFTQCSKVPRQNFRTVAGCWLVEVQGICIPACFASVRRYSR